MTKTSATIVFFGNERIATGVVSAVPTLTKLLANGYDIAMVVTNHQRQSSRKQRDLEIAEVAREHDIPVLLPERLSDIKEQLRVCNAQIGVLVAYGNMVPQSIIKLFPKGIINIHPSLLPLHRGSTPVESAILAGETQTGVSIMSLAKEMDAGPVYTQKAVPLNGSETKQQLANRLLDIGSDLVIKILPAILDGTATSIPQDSKRATYDTLISKSDGNIHWRDSATQIEREIRAYSEWPKSYTKWGQLEATITQAHVINLSGIPGKTATQDKLPVVYCGQHALVIDRLKPAGKQEMTGEAFLAGYRQPFLAS